MGWERRGGRSYYYTAERVGGRVVKLYVGTGHVAALAARLDAATRQQRASEGEADSEALADLDALAAALVPLYGLAANNAMFAGCVKSSPSSSWWTGSGPTRW